MLQCFYPDKYIVSTYQINFDRLYEQGYRGIIFDIDNTLVEHGAPADERSIALFRHLKELGFRIMLLSNNKEPRVKMFNDAVQVQYLFKAGKPGKAGYEQAMKKLGCREHAVCRRPAVYGCLGSQTVRNLFDSGTADCQA